MGEKETSMGGKPFLTNQTPPRAFDQSQTGGADDFLRMPFWIRRSHKDRQARAMTNSVLAWPAVAFIICVLSALYLNKAQFKAQGSLAACLATQRVPFVAESSKEFERLATPWNLRLKYRPAAIAMPHSADQVRAAVLCGVKSGVRVNARGGGHSFGSFSSGGEDGHLVVDTRRMNGIALRNQDGVARIQPGARLGRVAKELYNQGRRGIPHGTCPGVGIAGHLLHGGYGMASRAYGLTLDWLVGATVILANGSQVHCSATENTDLFWALRGAGSSFGIVAEFELQTFSVPDVVTPFTVDLSWTEAQAVQGFKAFQELAVSAARDLNLWFAMDGTGKSILQGVYLGDVNAFEDAIRPFLERAHATVSFANTMNWLEANEYFASGEQLEQNDPYDSHRMFYGTSLVTNAIAQDLIESFMAAVFSNLKNVSARHSWDLSVAFHGGDASAIADIHASATAYVHRDKLLVYQFSDYGIMGKRHPEDSLVLLKRFRESMTNALADEDWGMYANYIDTALDGHTAQQLYWGDNLPRLRRIKSSLDPQQVFWDPHSVGPQS